MPSSGYRKQTMDFGEMSRDLQSAAASFTKMSAAAAGFVSLVGAFKTFELEVTKANSAIGGTATTFKQLGDAARNFALISKYSAGEAAGSMVMLAQAGFDANEVMSAMPHVLQLAQASMENLELVADTVASTIRTYNLSAEEAARVTNVFAASCVNSLATVNKLAFSFRQVGPVAAEMGMSIEETAAALDVLYNRGLRGEQAGTALRNILVRLVKPTQDTLKAFSLLGIGLKNVDGTARNLQSILKDLKEANLDDAYLAKIFGREALAASKTLIAATTGEYDRMKESITDTNTVARMANAQMNTMDGALKLIKNSLNEVGIIIGQSIGPLVKQVASYIQDFAIYLRTADSSTISFIKNLGTFIGILGTAKFGISRLLAELNGLAAVGGKVTSVFSALTNMAIFKASGAGLMTLKNYADELRMFEMAQAGGTNWYSNVNEFYKSVNKGVGISMKAATEIKNLTAAQVAYRKAVIAGAAATKTFGASMWALVPALVKLLLVVGPLLLAFKAYDSYMKERERRQQELSDAFPEIEYLDQKIKELKVTTANDLPAIVKQYKEAMNAMATAQEVTARINLQGLSLEDGKVVQSAELKSGLEEIKKATLEQIKKYGTINEHDLRQIAKEKNVSYDLLEVYLKGVKERLKDAKDTLIENPFSELPVMISRADDAVNQGIGALSRFIDTNTEALIKMEEETRKGSEVAEKKITEIISDLSSANSKLNWLLSDTSNKELNDKIKQYFKEYVLGVSTADLDMSLQEGEGREKLKQLLEKHGNDLNSVLKDFRKNFLKGLISDTEMTSVEAPVIGQMDATVTVTPIDVSKSESAVESLRKKVSDMMADYRLSLEFLTAQQESELKLGKIQTQQDVNRESRLNSQKALIQELYDKTQVGLLSVEALEPTLKNIDATTGAWLGKEKALAVLLQNKTGEAVKFGKLKLEQIDLLSREEFEQKKLLNQEKERLTVANNRYKYEQEHLKILSDEIAKLDSLATTDASAGNFVSGLQAGLLGVEKQIDSVYDMGKKGMQGFADYMADSMYDVVENWDKGWESMKEALRSTLVEMLKDMAKYFAKQAAYSAVMGLFGSYLNSARAAFVNQTWIGHDANAYGPWNQAKGGAWKNGMQTFAKGGVVGQPTFFNTRSGKGLMGEAGPEAIMPLKRDKDGNLGVSVEGNGNNYSSTIIINAQTGSAQTKSDNNYSVLAKQLDTQIRGVVLSTLVREKKPGGLLA